MSLFIKKYVALLQRLRLRLQELSKHGYAGTAEYNQLYLMLQYLMQIKKYIVKGDWARTTVREKLQFWVNSQYNYQHTADKYKTDVNSIKVLVSRADSTLRNTLEEPVSLIADGNIMDGWIAFCINTKQLDVCAIFGRPISMDFPQPDITGNFNLSDCKAEIAFLKKYNYHAIAEQLKLLDENKLAYLLALCSNQQIEYREEQKKLASAILSSK